MKDGFLQKKSKIDGFKELYTLDAKDKVLNYFKGFINGKIHVLDPSPLRKKTRFLTSRIVFKVIHGGEFFINDAIQHTNSKVIYLLRHPIAVSLSRKQLPRTHELTSDLVLSYFPSKEQKFIRDVMATGDDMDKRILMWCVQNKLALYHRTDDWLVISYEDLTIRPQKILTKIATHCDLPDVNAMMENVNIPSAVTTQSELDSVNIMKKDNERRQILISKWRDKVSESDAIRYFDICRKMNFELYGMQSDFPESSFIYR